MKAWKLGLCGCALLLACSDDGPGSGPDAGIDTNLANDGQGSDPDASIDTNLADDVATDLPIPDELGAPDAGATITVGGTFTLDDFKTPIPDIDVCLYKAGQKTTVCTKTSATGDYTIAVPASAKVGLLFDKAGYQNGFMPLYLTAPVAKWTHVKWTDAQATAEYTKVGVTYPFVGNGSAVVNGAAISIATVPQAGSGPYYGTSGFDPSLTRSPTGSGWGEIMDLPPGEYDVDVTHPTKTCVSTVGWPPTAGHTLRVPVLDGYVTSHSVQCQ